MAQLSIFIYQENDSTEGDGAGFIERAHMDGEVTHCFAALLHLPSDLSGPPNARKLKIRPDIGL